MVQGEALVLGETAVSTERFDAFYLAEHVRLFRSLLLLTGSREEAEDIAHEAFVRVLEGWDRIGAMTSPRAYLHRTALNLQRNALRRRWRRLRWAPVDRDIERDASEPAIARVEVLRALQGLSWEQREAVVLVDFLDLSAQEAGGVLGIQADAVRARVHRGRVKLREELIEDG